jgi:hypothetical protein
MKAFIILVLFLSSPVGITIGNTREVNTRLDSSGRSEESNFNSGAQSDFQSDNAIIFCMLLNPN